MPSADDLLEAMRKAGQDFARMADSIEARLPALMSELAEAATTMRPLTAELDKVQGKIKDISKAAKGITFSHLVDELKETNAGMAALFKSADAVGKKLGKISMRHIDDEIRGITGSLGNMAKQTAIAANKAIREISGMGRALGDTLAERTVQTQKLASRLKELGRGAGAGGGRGTSLEIRNAAELTQNFSNLVEVADAFAAAGDGGSRAMQSLQAHLTGIGKTTMSVDDDITDLVSSYKALGPAIGEARDNAAELAKGTGLDEWKKSSEDALKSIEEATADIQKRSGIDLGHGKWIDDLKTSLKSLGTDSGPEAFDAIAREMERLKATTHLLSNDMISGIKKQSEEYLSGILVGRGQQAKMYKWRKSQEMMHQMLMKQGHGERMSRLMAFWAAWKDHPIKSVRDDIAGITDELSKAARETGLFAKGFLGTVKMAMSVRDRIIEQREELMKLTAEGGRMSALLQSGMAGEAVIGEFDKLNKSIDNLFFRIGMTSEQTREMMGTLMAAGVSFKELTGDTLKAGEAQGILRQEGEYTMTGLEDLGMLAKMTGRSFGDIARMAGKWREELGVSLGDVKETYLEVESQARRSGLSVGRFMDRVMSAASGFVLFGARVEDVAASLSNLMAKMDLPPSMAADLSKRFMDVMKDTTIMGAQELASFLQDEGQAWALTQMSGYVAKIKQDKNIVDREIADIREKMKEKSLSVKESDRYLVQLAELKKRSEKYGKDFDNKNNILSEAADGSTAAMGTLIWYMQKGLDSSSAQMHFLAMASRLQIDITDIMEDGVPSLTKLKELLESKMGDVKWMELLRQEQLTGQLGGIKDMMEFLSATAEQSKSIDIALKLVTRETKEINKLKGILDRYGAEEFADAAAKFLNTPQEVHDLLEKMLEQGALVSDEAFDMVRKQMEVFKDAKGIKEKEAKATNKAILALTREISGKREAPDEEQLKEQMDPLVKAQLKTKDQIKELKDALMKEIGPWGGIFWSILANTTVMALSGFFKPGGLLPGGAAAAAAKGAKGVKVKPLGVKVKPTAVKPVGRIARAGQRVTQELGKRAPRAAAALKTAKPVIAARVAAMKTTAATVKGGAGKLLGKVAGPISAGIISYEAASELQSLHDQAAADAGKHAKEEGKTLDEIAAAKKKAGKAALKDAAPTVGRAGGALAGMMTGAVALGAIGTAVFPGVGTVVLGIIGAVGGAIVGAIGGEMGGGLEVPRKFWGAVVEGAYRVNDGLDALADGLFGSAKDHEAATTKEIRASEARAAAIEDEILAAEAAKVAAKDEAEHKRKLAEMEEKLYRERKKQILAMYREGTSKSWFARLAGGWGRISGRQEELAERGGRYYARQTMAARRAGDAPAKVARPETPAHDVRRVSRGGLAYLSMRDVVIHGDEMAKLIKGAKGVAAGPFRLGGRAVAAPGDIGRMAAVPDAAAVAGIGGAGTRSSITDNSTWTVNISSHRDKEIEAIVRKVMIEHQERQAP